MRASANQEIKITFRNEDDSGILSDADLLPTAVLYNDGSIDSSVTVTIARLSEGVYRASWTMGDYTEGDIWELVVDAVVDGIEYSRIVKEGYIGEENTTIITNTNRLTRLYAFVGEESTTSFYATGYDLDSRTIDFIIGSRSNSDRSPRIFGVNDTIIPDSEIITSDSLVTITIPTSLTTSVCVYPWVLTDRDTGDELIAGWLDVFYPA